VTMGNPERMTDETWRPVWTPAPPERVPEREAPARPDRAAEPERAPVSGRARG
jgi:hypothetical protein